LVLLVVWRLGNAAYGLSVRDEIHARAGRTISVSTAYLTMTRLEGKGLVRSRVVDPRPVRGGKGRRVFVITRSGTAAVKRARMTMDRMWDGLEGLTPGLDT